MRDFVNIATVYSNKEERNLKYLTALYSDRNKIKAIIIPLLKGTLIDDRYLYNKTVLIKPNWVTDKTSENDELCLYTNNSFVLAVLEIIASQNPRKIILGDAPIQGCNWERILTPEFTKELQSVCDKSKVPLEICDFRNVIFSPKVNKFQRRDNHNDFTIFDLGIESMLEIHSLVDRNPFRVTYYNPDRLKSTHYPGTHKYCIANAFLQADVVLSLPKIKTHQKTGITAALKNIVGVNGDKDSLPHHRIGGTGRGGDCYPGANQIRYLSERLRDIANRNIGVFRYRIWAGLSYILWNTLPASKLHSPSAGWHGNDTTWRMVLDLNKIALYGKLDGTISNTKQRTIFSLCDGIIAGQGDGPLNPDPLPLGIISFTDQSAFHDICMAVLLSFDWKKIPLLKNSFDITVRHQIMVFLNSKEILFDDLRKISLAADPPPGWKDYLKHG